jgi:hypothetical protein
LQSSLIISMTSHSKMLLSLTRPHEMPGRSFADCICFSCRLSSEPAAAELVDELAMVVCCTAASLFL